MITVHEDNDHIFSALRNGDKKIFLLVDGVRYHIRNIYAKLDANNRADAISKAHAKKLIR